MKNNWLLKMSFLACGCMAGSALFAQGLLVEKKDGTQIKIPYELLERVTVYEADGSLSDAVRAAIAGDYYGDLKTIVAGSEMVQPGCVAHILAQENGKFSIAIPEKAEGKATKGMELPSMTLQDIEMVLQTDKVYAFSQKDFSVEVDGTVYSFNELSGTVDLATETFDFSFSVKPGRMPMYVNGSFTGKKGSSTPQVESPTDLAQCVEADVAALRQLSALNPQLGLFVGNNPSEWKNLEITWEKNAEHLYAVRRIDIKAEAQLENLVLRLDAKEPTSVFQHLQEINVASAGVKEFVVVDQPLLEKVSLNGLGKAPVGAVNVQGGMALQHVAIENLPSATEIFLGGDSLLNVTLADLPSLQEQSNLKFRQFYAETNTKDTRIQKLTLKGNLNKLNGLYLNDLGLQQLAIETTLPEVTGISLNKNRLTESFDLKGLGKLTSLYLRNNQLEKISLSDCPMLKELDASTNKTLAKLDLDLTALTHLDASETSLTGLDITHLKALKNLSVSNSKLATLNFDGGNTALERINLSNNQLTTFALPAEVVEPYQIYLNNNRLTALDLKHAANLEELYISNNELDTFVTPDEKEVLGTLECGGNHFPASFLRNLEEGYSWSDLLAAPQFIQNRVNGRQVDAKAEVALGMEPYVVKKVGDAWEEVTDIQHQEGIFTLPEGATYRVICTEDVFSFIIYNMEFSFEAPYLIGEVE